ncbi:hypothetical protein Tco_0992948 [Tanacetum coccineum]|uniref:Uncharacterized protein n=1 Tax=Tanacetum coccineum TaxID=301880 RepID=A0ABQ5F4G4_9ASTR
MTERYKLEVPDDLNTDQRVRRIMDNQSKERMQKKMRHDSKDDNDEQKYRSDAEMTDAQTNQETEEVHVTLTTEPLVVQQQSSSVYQIWCLNSLIPFRIQVPDTGTHLNSCWIFNIHIHYENVQETLHLPVETPENPFVTPANIHTIEAFMNRVGYQGVFNKVSAFYTKNLAQPWQTMFKVFNHWLTTRTSGHDQTKINILQLFHVVLNQTHVDYVSLLWWEFMNYVFQKRGSEYPIPLVSANTIGNVLVRGMLILDVLLTAEIIEMDDFKEYGEVFRKETHNKIDDILHEVIPQIAENVTNDLIEANLKLCIVNTIIEDHDAFRSEVPAFISKEFKAHAPAIIKELFKNHVQSNVIHVHPTTTTSTKTKSSANLQYQLEDDFHSHHDEHQDDDAPPEGEKRVKRSKMSKRLKSARDSSSKHSRKDSTTYVSKQQSQHQEWDAWEEENVVDEDEYGNTKEKKYILSLHKIHAEEFSEPNLEENLNRWVQKEFKTFNEDAKRANDKPNSFSEADFKYLNKNDIEDLYYLCRSKEIDNQKVKLMNSLITFIRSCVIWERNMYHTLIVERATIGLIYLNSKDEKIVMYLEEIIKFCDATLEKVLNEVKLRMFESKFLKKPPLLGDLDQDIMKTISTDDEASVIINP